ncbi:MAG TPA: hypothetical protein VGN64_05345 [Dyadobacter sp.]|jgi:hypothetical protein|nr:hypothetical protein [Dyadobacter sp.]
MKEPDVIGKYENGQKVFARVDPKQELTIRRYYNRIYYCRATEGDQKEHAYFEREIFAAGEF